jgi:hypothetical protein
MLPWSSLPGPAAGSEIVRHFNVFHGRLKAAAAMERKRLRIAVDAGGPLNEQCEDRVQRPDSMATTWILSRRTNSLTAEAEPIAGLTADGLTANGSRR